LGSRVASGALFGLAVLGALVGLYIGFMHLTTDPLADVHAYYEAGARLNAGQPLYEQSASTAGSHYYFYPPLLAVAFRPLALLPFEAAAAIWQGVVIASFIGTLWLIGLRNRWLWLALGWLAAPLAWSIVIGQAHVPVLFLLTVGSPFSLALAGHLKIFPALAAVFWLGRRDWRRLGRFIAWTTGLVIVSFVLEPSGTIAFLGFPDLALVGEVTNLSPYAISPVVWAILAVGLGLAALVLAPTRFGWLAAVAWSVLVSPRLFLYQLSSLLAALRQPAGARDN
jgi:hypothetical protein